METHSPIIHNVNRPGLETFLVEWKLRRVAFIAVLVLALKPS